MCTRGVSGSVCVESIYRNYTLFIWPDSEPTKLRYHSKQKPRREGASDSIGKQLPPSTSTGHFSRKADIYDLSLLVI